MDIKEAIQKCSTTRIRSVAKNEAIYDGAKAAKEAEPAMAKANKAKDQKAFDKAKKECLTSVEDGQKAIKPWQKEMDTWDADIKELEKAITAEKEKLAQLQKEDAAVQEAIAEVNAQIKAYNDSLLLKSRDPRARPFVTRKDNRDKVAAIVAVIADAQQHAQHERETWSNQKEWVSKPIDELTDLKGKASKAKYTGK